MLGPVEDAVDSIGQSISCSIGGSVLGGIGSVASGIFGQGRATLGAQIAQYATQTAGNLCQGRQLSIQKELLKYEMLNNEGGDADPSEGIGEYLSVTLAALEDGGFLADERSIAGAYGAAYPGLFDAMSPDDLIETDRQLGRQARRAEMLSFGVGNRALVEQARGVGRAREYAAAGRDGGGTRAELQAGNAIQTEQVAAINGLTAVTVANNRAAAEVRLKEEARKAAANRAAEDFIKGFGECSDCELSRPLLGNY
jgi:hypothetical protein